MGERIEGDTTGPRMRETRGALGVSGPAARTGRPALGQEGECQVKLVQRGFLR